MVNIPTGDNVAFFSLEMDQENKTLDKFVQMQKKAETNESKGKFGGDCNVTQCQKPGACCYNHAMRAYYCKSCAEEINKFSRIDNGVNLCEIMEDHSHLDENVSINEEQNRKKRIRSKKTSYQIGPTAPFRRVDGKIGRNDKCPCGSGLKYKKCCLNNK